MAGSNVKLLENLIDYCSIRNKVISKNIVNIGTEGYKRQELVFEKLIENNAANLKGTTDKHLKPGSDPGFNISVDNSPDNLSGINNVDIEKEMADLAENTIQFKLASRKLGDYYKQLQRVIKGGGA